MPVLHDDAGAEETQAAHDAGGDAGQIELARIRETVHGDEHEQCGAQRHEDVGADAGALAADLALQADGGPEQRGSQQADGQF